MFWLEKLGIEQKWLTLTNLVLTDSNLLLFAIILLLNKKKHIKRIERRKFICSEICIFHCVKEFQLESYSIFSFILLLVNALSGKDSN